MNVFLQSFINDNVKNKPTFLSMSFLAGQNFKWPNLLPTSSREKDECRRNYFLTRFLRVFVEFLLQKSSAVMLRISICLTFIGGSLFESRQFFEGGT